MHIYIYYNYYIDLYCGCSDARPFVVVLRLYSHLGCDDEYDRWAAIGIYYTRAQKELFLLELGDF
jgi:hypothetical protein